MFKSNLIGIAGAALIIISAFLPWLTIDSKHLLLTGLDTTGTSFGEPGKLAIALSVVAIIFFLLPKVWAQRVNLFVCAFLLAWAFRNMLIFSRCEMGECPHRQIGLYLSLLGGLVAFVSVLASKVRPK